ADIGAVVTIDSSKIYANQAGAGGGIYFGSILPSSGGIVRNTVIADNSDASGSFQITDLTCSGSTPLVGYQNSHIASLTGAVIYHSCAGDKTVSSLNALPNGSGNDAAAPTFVSFLATPDAAPAVLSWSAARATSVTVAGPGIGSVDVAQRTGTMDVAGTGGTCPTATYTLTAHPSGTQATQSLACGPPSGNPSLTSQLSASALHPGNTLTIT